MSEVIGIHTGYIPPGETRKDVAATLHAIADCIERGDYGDVLHVGIIIDNGKELLQLHRSTMHTTKLEWIGLLTCAIQYLFHPKTGE